MRTFEKMAAQGDVLFLRADALPETAKEVSPVDGRVTVTHSETGHDHVMELDREAEEPNVKLYADDENPLLAWLEVKRPSVLKHLRGHDTHEPIQFGPGIYQVRRQREYTPEGFRRVED